MVSSSVANAGSALERVTRRRGAFRQRASEVAKFSPLRRFSGG